MKADIQTLLDEIAGAVQPKFGKDNVADYIPALARVPADRSAWRYAALTAESGAQAMR